jgi:pectate lyase
MGVLKSYNGVAWVEAGFQGGGPQVINAQSGSAYTFAVSDQGRMVTTSNSAAVVLTVPTNTVAALPVGSRIDIAALGTGQVTVAGASGVVVLGASMQLSVRYSSATLLKTSTNTWVLLAGGSAVAGVLTPRIDIMSAFDQQFGYGELYGVTGGQGYDVTLVTTSADSGAGSYREALTTGGGNKIIRFDPSLDTATITLLTAIETAYNNITVDGTGIRITIGGDATRFNGTNIILCGLNFYDNNDGSYPNTDLDETDAITFRNPTTVQSFIVAFCSFKRGGDGLIDIIWNKGNNVHGTIVGCDFAEHDKAILVNSGSATEEGGAYYITLAQSWCHDFKQRMILARDAHIHQYNTFIDEYGDEVGGGTVARLGDPAPTPPPAFTQQYFAENNVVMPRNVGDLTYKGVAVTNARNPWFTASGVANGNQRMRATGSLLLSSASDTAQETNGTDQANVAALPYSGYPLATATTALSTWLTTVIGDNGAKSTTLQNTEPKVPAASYMVIKNGQVITVKTEEAVSAVTLKLGVTNIGTMVEGAAGTWTVTLASLPVTTTTGNLTAEATYASGTVVSNSYPAFVA